MSLPTRSDLEGLEFVVGGVPFNNIQAKDLGITDPLEFVVGGLPFYALAPSGTPPAPSYNATQFFIMF